MSEFRLATGVLKREEPSQLWSEKEVATEEQPEEYHNARFEDRGRVTSLIWQITSSVTLLLLFFNLSGFQLHHC